MVQRSASKKPLPQAKPVAGGRPAGSRANVTAKQTSIKAQAVSDDDADNDDGNDDEEEYEDEDYDGNPFVNLLEANASWLTSMVVHIVALLVLAFITTKGLEEDELPIVASAALDPIEEVEEIEPLEFDVSDIEDVPINDELLDEPEALKSENPEIDNLDEGADSVSQELTEFSTDEAAANEFLDQGFGTGSADSTGAGRGKHGTGMGMGGRGDRRSGAMGRGATKDSEDAVDLALKWLAAHQMPDGSWNFDHRKGTCQGRCDKQGSYNASHNAATAIGLLPFLGAGQTHVQGKYQKNVAAGLKYLLATMKVNGDTGSWHEKVGNSYSHGLATLAMTEAYAMSNVKPAKPAKPGKSMSEMTREEKKKFLADKKRAKKKKNRKRLVATADLRRASQAALNWIRDAQDMNGGGWRYARKRPGDTSVVGWMLMGLKSGVLSNLDVRRDTVIGASKFLDSVQCDDYGSLYRYMATKKRPIDSSRATTAIGLLCRMYLGWSRDHPGIAQGVQHLNQWGPSTGGVTNMYYNYYATQVMHHYGGDLWEKSWNPKMRDYLVKSQAAKGSGHKEGSWFFGGAHGASQGGRLYGTALAAMTLEIYYRYMPIYDAKSVEEGLDKPAEGNDDDDFKLDGDDEKDKKKGDQGKKSQEKKDDAKHNKKTDGKKKK